METQTIILIVIIVVLTVVLINKQWDSDFNQKDPRDHDWLIITGDNIGIKIGSGQDAYDTGCPKGSTYEERLKMPDVTSVNLDTREICYPDLRDGGRSKIPRSLSLDNSAFGDINY